MKKLIYEKWEWKNRKTTIKRLVRFKEFHHEENGYAVFGNFNYFAFARRGPITQEGSSHRLSVALAGTLARCPERLRKNPRHFHGRRP
jgi:hypothetical protein